MPHTSPEGEPTARRVLNLKALAILVGCGTLFSVLTGWVHAKQLIRTSDYLKATADQALADDDPNQAFDIFEQYLALNPNDEYAQEKVSQLLEKHGDSAKALLRAFHTNERLLLKDKSRDDLRLRQIRIAERLGRYSDAAVHLKTMRDNRSDMSEVWHFSGIVARDTGDFANAIQYFETAINLKNPMAESFEFLATLKTQEQNDSEAAGQLLDRLIAEQDSAKARRIRAAWYIEQNQPVEALSDLWRAISQKPTDMQTNAMLLKAVRQAKSNDHKYNAEQQYLSIIGHLKTVLMEDPDQHKLRLYLSSALWATNYREAAIANLELGLQRDPRQFEMQEVLVDYLVSAQKFDRAQQVFDNIPNRVIERGRREFMRGRLLMAQENWIDAISAFEMALGFAREDANMASRARVCLALCRRETGDNVAAMDAYRSLVRANPDFEGGRLGMASAYLRADQTTLAIAQYKQLLHVEGVPAFLANLMIRDTLSKPKHNRDWTDLDDMLRDRNPVVKDQVQRILLQADLMFAKGFPAKAMDKLDHAARQMPDREEIQRAYHRLSSIHGDSLKKRILNLLDEDPGNTEGHISYLRLLVAQEDTAGLITWLRNLMSGATFANLSQQQRLEIAAYATTNVLEAELITRGNSDRTDAMTEHGRKAWKQLTDQSPRHLENFIRFVAAHDSVEAATRITIAAPTSIDPDILAKSWLTCLHYGIDQPSVKDTVESALVELIHNNPNEISLKLAFADYRILLQQYDQAENYLRQLAEFDTDSGLAQGRLAWIALFIRHNSTQALELSRQAMRRSSRAAGVRSLHGLILAENSQPEDALDVLTSIPANERAVSSYLFEARIRVLLGQTIEATDMVRELSYRTLTSELKPAEAELLKTLQQQLQVLPR